MLVPNGQRQDLIVWHFSKVGTRERETAVTNDISRQALIVNSQLYQGLLIQHFVKTKATIITDNL